jgi:hypothetical protein
VLDAAFLDEPAQGRRRPRFGPQPFQPRRPPRPADVFEQRRRPDGAGWRPEFDVTRISGSGSRRTDSARMTLDSTHKFLPLIPSSVSKAMNAGTPIFQYKPLFGSWKNADKSLATR